MSLRSIGVRAAALGRTSSTSIPATRFVLAVSRTHISRQAMNKTKSDIRQILQNLVRGLPSSNPWHTIARDALAEIRKLESELEESK
jgi:hypothetical protein